MSDDQTADVDPSVGEHVHEPENLRIVSDAEILAYLLLDDILSIDHNYGLSVLTELHQHPDLTVRHESGKNTGCVIIIEKLAPELKIELTTEFLDALSNVLGLGLKVHVVVESDLHAK